MKKTFDVCIGNYGYYAAGQLRDKWVTLPMADSDLRAWLKTNGLADAMHEEIYISDYDKIPFGLPYGGAFSEQTDLFSLNMLAKVIDGAEQWELDTVESALSCGVDAPKSPEELANMVLQAGEIPYADLPEYGPFSSAEERLGYMQAEESGLYDKLDEMGMADYFDYESYGRDLACEVYLGEDGYIYGDMPSFDLYDYEELYALSAEWDEKRARLAAA